MLLKPAPSFPNSPGNPGNEETAPEAGLHFLWGATLQGRAAPLCCRSCSEGSQVPVQLLSTTSNNPTALTEQKTHMPAAGGPTKKREAVFIFKQLTLWNVLKVTSREDSSYLSPIPLPVLLPFFLFRNSYLLFLSGLGPKLEV